MTAEDEIPEEWHEVQHLRSKLAAILDESGAKPNTQAVAAIMTAARYAARAQIPVEVAFAMLAGYVVRGEPV